MDVLEFMSANRGGICVNGTTEIGKKCAAIVVLTAAVFDYIHDENGVDIRSELIIGDVDGTVDAPCVLRRQSGGIIGDYKHVSGTSNGIIDTTEGE